MRYIFLTAFLMGVLTAGEEMNVLDTATTAFKADLDKAKADHEIKVKTAKEQYIGKLKAVMATAKADLGTKIKERIKQVEEGTFPGKIVEPQKTIPIGDVVISAGVRNGLSLGSCPRGTKIVLQYIKGEWTFGEHPEKSPDNKASLPEQKLCIGEIKDNEFIRLSIVPNGTAQQPFSYQLLRDVENLVLRISEPIVKPGLSGEQWGDNSGEVIYKLKVN